ncbi:hypothetical protein [Gordonia sp. (in: high G+C Gram-positive bacteria)]|uniref:hypothetical protein n=1 Tax=Gordonia sp. (in: high G+C Gram-positive bacteria) TaxID=84139 RepID=UPI00352966E5
MSARHEDDVSELAGLRTTAAALLVGVFIGTYALIVFATAAPSQWLAQIPAWLLTSGAAIALIRAPGDPAPLGWTLFIASAGPVAAILVFAAVDVPLRNHLEIWPLSATTALGVYLCVRGRTIAAWISIMSAILAAGVWADLTGQGFGYGISISLINLAPMVVATFFGFTIRPAARDIFALRRAGTAAAAAEAADNAALDERDRQLQRLDSEARPLLERLAAPRPLTDAERRSCALVEARLRDSLRAPVLDAPELVDAVWQARTRGVEVVLLDDHGLDGAPDVVRERLVGAMVPALSGAAGGTVTIRILPPGRRVLATVLRASGDDIDRAEYDADGELIAAN